MSHFDNVQAHSGGSDHMAATAVAHPVEMNSTPGDLANGKHPAPSVHGHMDYRALARQTYRDSLAAGTPLTGRQPADLYGYSRSWGRDRINEVRRETEQTYRSASNRGGAVEPTPSPNESGPGSGTPKPPNARRVAWLAFVIGVAASVAANVMHAQVISTNPAAWIGAAFWPVALLLAIEVLARVHWPAHGRWYALARYGGTTMVSLVAAVLSYRHMAGLLATWGEDSLRPTSVHSPSTAS